MLRINVFNAHRTRRVRTTDAVEFAKRVLRGSGLKSAQISIVFVDSRYARRMNRKYLNRDYATDVICFPLETGVVLEGEIYVNLDQARKQASELGVSFGNEVARLVIHGALHLAGFDDSTKRKARQMKAEEDRHVRHWFQ